MKKENKCVDVYVWGEINLCSSRHDGVFSNCKFYSPVDNVYDECRWFDGSNCTSPTAIRDKDLYKALEDI